MVSDRYRSNDSPIVVDDGGMTKLIGLAFALFAVFGLLYLSLHSIEWSALITLVFIVTPGIVYLVTWIRVKDHQMNMDKARLAVEANLQVAGQPVHAGRLPQGRKTGTNWAPSIAGGSQEMVTDFDQEGRRMSVSMAALGHFIETQWPQPNRERQWGMQDDDYGQVARFLCQIEDAPLQPMGRTFVWREGITKEIMSDWLSDIKRRGSVTLSQALSVTEKAYE